MSRHDVYFVSAQRTPVGKGKGVFKNTRPDDLLAHCIQSVIHSVPNFDPALIGDCVIGCAMPEGSQGMNIARIAVLLAGLPQGVPGVTVNRFCASGLQAIADAANRIALGEIEAAIAGGAESMSQVPLGGSSYSANPIYSDLHAPLVGMAYNMGITAEKVAEKWQITRDEQDAFALQSHTRALAAQAHDFFKNEITPTPAISRNLLKDKLAMTEQLILQDQGPRSDTNLSSLGKLKTVFKANGTVTAGNSSQISDGAAALLLVNEATLKRFNLTPIAKWHGMAVRGVAPEVMGIGPIEAIPAALNRMNLKQDDLSWIELNEAFAAQSLAVIKTLGLDATKVNPLGGAIALGHPLGATGAIRACTVIHGLRRTKQQFGMVTMCIGTGMGAAGIIEAL